MKDQAIRVIHMIREHGNIAVFAGGAVRDELLDRPAKDWDVVTCMLPSRVKELFPHHVADGEDQGVIKVIIDGHVIDVATLRKDGSYSDGRRPDSVEFTDSLEEDARRRDFTINSMFFDPVSGDTHDFHGGKEHLENRLIVCVGDANDRFLEDKLRMMRAIRFACQLEFHIDISVLTAIKQNAAGILSVSKERIREELFKILATADAKRGIVLLEMTGLLPHILPEVQNLVGCEQDAIYHPEGDVWVHSLGVLEELANGMYSHKTSPELRFAGLIHDVGKTWCRYPYVDAEGRDRISNKGHAEVGAEMAAIICDRLALSNVQKFQITELVRLHMRAHLGKEMRRSKVVDLMRHIHFEDLKLLQHADALNSAAGECGKSLLSFYEVEQRKLKPVIDSTCIIGGRDLIAVGYTPGKHFSEILSWVREMQDDGVITTAEEALKQVLIAFPQ